MSGANGGANTSGIRDVSYLTPREKINLTIDRVTFAQRRLFPRQRREIRAANLVVPYEQLPAETKEYLMRVAALPPVLDLGQALQEVAHDMRTVIDEGRYTPGLGMYVRFTTSGPIVNSPGSLPANFILENYYRNAVLRFVEINYDPNGGGREREFEDKSVNDLLELNGRVRLYLPSCRMNGEQKQNLELSDELEREVERMDGWGYSQEKRMDECGNFSEDKLQDNLLKYQWRNHTEIGLSLFTIVQTKSDLETVVQTAVHFDSLYVRSNPKRKEVLA